MTKHYIELNVELNDAYWSKRLIEKNEVLEGGIVQLWSWIIVLVSCPNYFMSRSLREVASFEGRPSFSRSHFIQMSSAGKENQTTLQVCESDAGASGSFCILQSSCCFEKSASFVHGTFIIILMRL